MRKARPICSISLNILRIQQISLIWVPQLSPVLYLQRGTWTAPPVLECHWQFANPCMITQFQLPGSSEHSVAEQRLSSEANSRSAGQETATTLGNARINYRVTTASRWGLSWPTRIYTTYPCPVSLKSDVNILKQAKALSTCLIYQKEHMALFV
jgi:hypothetical protein